MATPHRLTKHLSFVETGRSRPRRLHGVVKFHWEAHLFGICGDAIATEAA